MSPLSMRTLARRGGAVEVSGIDRLAGLEPRLAACRRGMSSSTPRLTILSFSAVMAFARAPLDVTCSGPRSLYILPSK